MFEYSSVSFSDQREKSITEGIARKFNEWGDSILKPVRAKFGGRNYEVIFQYSRTEPKKLQARIRDDSGEGMPQKNTLSCANKIRGFIGSCFKKIAAFICKEIRREFDAANKGDSAYFLKKLAPRPVKNKAEGQGDIEGFAWLMCCPCMLLMALDPNRRH